MSDSIVVTTLASAKAHPGRRLIVQYAMCTLIFGGLGAALVWAMPLAGVALLGVAAVFVWSAWTLRRGIREVSLLNHAYAACGRGEDEDARALIDAAAASAHSRMADRTILAHRALLALDGGDPKNAEALATVALDVRPGLLARDLERSQLTWVHALRALSRAALKNDAAALEDTEQACDLRYATPRAYACGELARALVAANGDRKAEVRKILDRAAPFLDEIGGRDRTLARSLARFAADRPRTVYRHPAKTNEVDHASILLQPATTKSSVNAFEATNVNVPLTKQAKARAQNLGRRTLVLWVLLVLMFLAIWQMLNPSQAPSNPAPPSTYDETWWSRGATPIAVGLLVIFVGMIALRLRSAMRQRAALRQAVMNARRGDASAIALLEGHAQRRSADASLALATLAERSGDFAGALARCEEGLAYAEQTSAARAVNWDILIPDLTAERAFCLAALGRVDDAVAVIGSLPNATNHAHAGTAQFRVRLAHALVRGDRAGALAVARSRGDRLPIPSRDAVLVDLLEATEGNGADDEEWSRLQAELAANGELAKWVDHFMPQSTIKRRVVEPFQEEELLHEHAEAVEQS